MLHLGEESKYDIRSKKLKKEFSPESSDLIGEKVMKKLNVIAVIAFAMTIMSLTANAQIGGVRVQDRQVRDLLGRIETRTGSFKREIDLSLNRTPIAGTNREDRKVPLASPTCTTILPGF